MLTAFVWLTFNQRFLYPTLQNFGDIHSKKYRKHELQEIIPETQYPIHVSSNNLSIVSILGLTPMFFVVFKCRKSFL